MYLVDNGNSPGGVNVHQRTRIMKIDYLQGIVTKGKPIIFNFVALSTHRRHFKRHCGD
jgi:hypothetical protein